MKKSATTNGITPRKMVFSGMSVTPAKTNTFMPIGGVIIPTSIILTIITPYHMGSNPDDRITGKKSE